MKGGLSIEGGFVYDEEIQLTVFKTSLFFSGDGFTVYYPKGTLVFRVDSYGPDNHDSDEFILMDASGHCLLTVRRKRRSLHQRWEGFLGERREGQKSIFSVRRSSMIGKSSVTVEMCGNTSEEYLIDGSFAQRCCTILNEDSEAVAEITRKVDDSNSLTLAKDVFSVVLKPGFDGAFAMALVLVLDQINADDLSVIDDGGVDLNLEPTHEHSNS